MKIEKESLSTTITDKEYAEAVEDEYGVSYTKDWEKLIYAPEQLTSYTIKEGTKVIGDSAFEGRQSLKYVNIPNSVTSIGDRAFLFCKSLKSINIPNSVTSIGDRAFLGCDSLKYVNISNSVTSIDKAAFTGCNSIKSFNIEGKNFFTENGLLISSEGVLIHCISTEPNI